MIGPKACTRSLSARSGQTTSEAVQLVEPTHKYDKVRLDGRSTPLKKAQEEFDFYTTDYMCHAQLPTMKPSSVLGAYTEDGDLRDKPLSFV